MKLKVEELLAERTHGVLHLLRVVDHVVLGHALHDGLVVGRLHVAHAVEQRLDILAVDAVLRIEHVYVVRMPRAADELARDARIGLRNANPRPAFDLPERFADGAAHRLDVLDTARMHPLDGFRHDADDLQPPPRHRARRPPPRRSTSPDRRPRCNSFFPRFSILFGDRPLRPDPRAPGLRGGLSGTPRREPPHRPKAAPGTRRSGRSVGARDRVLFYRSCLLQIT